jgi:osomolarity two-component system sensor histidine kinase SLN1
MANERNIDLHVDFEGPHDTNASEGTDMDGKRIYGPFGNGFVKDMVLWGDKTRILQVILNLTSNALKFTPQGGSVQVLIRCIGEEELSRRASLASRDESGQNPNHSELPSAIGQPYTALQPSSPSHSQGLVFEFDVRDSGPGIPVHLQERIFEPFFQGDMQLSKKYSGTGLGLSICQQLATLMQGSITLKSEEGSGSTFTMRIPLKYVGCGAGTSSSSSLASSRPSLDGKLPISTVRDLSLTQSSLSPITTDSTFEGDAERKSAEMDAPIVGSRNPAASSIAMGEEKVGARDLKILIAEDNKINQMIILRMLRMEKVLNVDVAQDGREALEMVKESIEVQSEYDLVLMDVQMPNMDGLEATRRIRQAGSKRPIIALSAYSDESNVRDCRDSGMDDFVSKPIQLARLRVVLQTFCPNDSLANYTDTSTSDAAAVKL